MTEPLGSSASSSVVPSVSVALPLVGIVTVREPVVTPKSPPAVTVTLTVSGADGAGVAESVKVTFPPSSPPAVPLMFTSGAGGSSLSATLTLAVPPAPETL